MNIVYIYRHIYVEGKRSHIYIFISMSLKKNQAFRYIFIRYYDRNLLQSSKTFILIIIHKEMDPMLNVILH